MTYGFYHTTSYSQVLVNVMPDQLFHSIWYDGGWNGLVLPVWVNGLLATLGLLALLAGVWALLHKSSIGGLQALGILGCVLGAVVACVQVAKSTSHVEGRVAYVGLCAFALIATMGAMAAFRRLGRPWMGLWVWPVLLLGVDAYVLVHFTIPLGGL